MQEQRFGRIIARGTDADIARTKRALDECEVMHAVLNGLRLEDTLSRDFYIEYHDSDWFRAREWVFTDGVLAGQVNYGRVHQGVLYVNSDARAWTQKHIVRHEACHVIDVGVKKQKELMLLMWKKNGTHPTNWNPSTYEARPEECHADTLAEAISGIDSPWDDFALYSLDVHEEDHRRFMKITFR